MRCAIAVGLGVAASGCGALDGAVSAPADPSAREDIRFTVPKGASASTLGGRLAKAGLVKSEFKWKLYLKRSAAGGCSKAGDFYLQPAMTAAELVETMCGVPIADEIELTIVEGWRIQEIDGALARAGLAQPGEYARAVSTPTAYSAAFALPTSTLEGYLFPETYRVAPESFDVEAFVQRQIDTFGDRFYSPNQDAFTNRSLDDVVVMASMVEREEPKEANAPMVAGILWKRLDDNWKLGVDATSRYTLDQWNDRRAFLRNLRDPNEPYNTRLRHGLPPTPIGNPGISALEAALKPVTSDYWFYLHDADQNLHPAKSLRGHEANRRRYNVY